MSETPIHRCPTCGSAVTVTGGEDEPGEGGTRHYEPVSGEDLTAGRERLWRINEWVTSAFDWQPKSMTCRLEAGCAYEALRQIGKLARGED